MGNGYIRPVWLEVNLDYLAENVRRIREVIGQDVKMMAVVKGDGYGTGSPGILDTLLEHGIDMFGVGILDEALMIRQKTLDIPVLIFGYTPYEHAALPVENNIIQTVYCREQAMVISAAARSLKKAAVIHIKIDTGMGRLGFTPSDETVEAIHDIARMPFLNVEGIYTHCPYTNETEGEGRAFTERQFREFRSVVNRLEEKNVYIPVQHVCNSLGTLNYPEMHLNMVRAGIILYGSYPYFQDVLPLKPVLSLKTRIAYIKTLPAGSNVSYGRTYVTEKETKVATLPLGYGDGYSRMLSNKAEVLVKGTRVPVIGTICMDQCMIDISTVEEPCTIGDEVVIFGKQDDETITIEELSIKACGYINYEYLTSIHRRVPRKYLQGGKPVRTISYLF